MIIDWPTLVGSINMIIDWPSAPSVGPIYRSLNTHIIDCAFYLDVLMESYLDFTMGHRLLR